AAVTILEDLLADPSY
nr:phosphoenolpyruvate carboxylase, PEPC, orthophosphate:oxaloacetate carboxy-lyase (phosphorylating) {internal fragment} {EC 4.1.1.31} [Streptomyces coelicolor, A3(2), Peptide Partial, 15 aa] [Streptomyces coelicolor]